MKKSLYLAFPLLLLAFSPQTAFLQTRNRTPKQAAINKMDKLEITIDNKRVYPYSRLYKLGTDSLLVIIPVAEGNDYGSGVNAMKTFELASIDEIVHSSRKKSILYSVIGGIGLGATSFFVAKKLFDKPREQLSINAIGQEYVGNAFEPYLAGVLGLGLGITIGRTMAETKVFPKKDAKEAYWRLKAAID